MKRFAIFGSGGVGGYFGGRLAQAGHDVTFIARGSHLAAMRQHGLRVDSIKGDFQLQAVQATDDPRQPGVVDVVLLAVKAWQVVEAAQALRPLVGPETLVVPLQNGVEAPAQLGHILGQEQVIGGFCRIVSYVVAPGHVRHAGGDPYLAFGELDNRLSQRTDQLFQAFAMAKGLTVERPADIQAAMWGKFLQIASWSGMGAVTRVPAGVWRALPGTRHMWQQAMHEVVAVARARGVMLDRATIEQATGYVDNLPAQATASMQRDILDGRPSELDSLSGGVVRLGQEAGVATPTHAFIYHSLLPLERKARGQAPQ